MQYCDPPQQAALRQLLERFGIALRVHAGTAPLPGSYWGEPEAGIQACPPGGLLHIRPDTPVHSALHEASHLICMDAERREHVERDAQGSDLEECAVCFLQILLAAHLPGEGSAGLMRDMDAWGYSFRTGSAKTWFLTDSTDAQDWLLQERLIEPGSLALPVPTAQMPDHAAGMPPELGYRVCFRLREDPR